MNALVLTYHLVKTTFSASFTFSAKEKDSETGLSYFGSRYYSSDLSIWLSVDPMSDKYPSLSPYVFCRNNPIILVDPNGEEWETVEDATFANRLVKKAERLINRAENKVIKLQNQIDRYKEKGKTEKFALKKTEEEDGKVTKKNIKGIKKEEPTR